MKPLPRPVPQKLKPLTGPFSTPEINDADLKRLWAQAKPLYVAKETGDLHWVKEPSDLRSVAYTWDPKLGEPAEGLDPLVTIRTFHTFSYYGFFKPSVAEVLAAVQKLPAEIRDKIVGFHLYGPKDGDDLSHEIEAVNAGLQVAYAVLYQFAERAP